jgi:hypothetical protein
MHIHKERETMSEVKKRKIYSSEVKAKVGLEALRGLKTINEIGQVFIRSLSGNAMEEGD